MVRNYKENGRFIPKRCRARVTMSISDNLKTQPKNCNSMKKKFEWSQSNRFDDYFDIRNYTIQPHFCTKHCYLKGCTVKHNCPGHEQPNDLKRIFRDMSRNQKVK